MKPPNTNPVYGRVYSMLRRLHWGSDLNSGELLFKLRVANEIRIDCCDSRDTQGSGDKSGRPAIGRCDGQPDAAGTGTSSLVNAQASGFSVDELAAASIGV
jgi:hypothetical protein